MAPQEISRRRFLKLALLGFAAACAPRLGTPEASPTSSPTFEPSETPRPAATSPATKAPESTSTPEATPTPEFPWGGDQVETAFHIDFGGKDLTEVPAELKRFLVPLSPAEWRSRLTLTDTDGKILQPGLAFTTLPDPNRLQIRGSVVPAFLSGMVQYGYDYGAMGDAYFAVIQFPAKGGTNYFLYQLSKGDYGSGRMLFTLPAEGVPAEWLGRDVPYTELLTRLTKKNWTVKTPNNTIPILQKHVGQEVLVEIPPIPAVDMNWNYDKLIGALTDGTLYPPDLRQYYPIVNGFFLTSPPP